MRAVLYATGFTKHTEKVAKYIAQKTGAEAINLKETSSVDLSKYDSIILGTGVHAGKPYKPLTEFVAANKDALAGKKTVLFVHCMFKGEKAEAQRKKIAEMLGIADAVYFNSKAEQMNDAGFPVAVDNLIARI